MTSGTGNTVADAMARWHFKPRDLKIVRDAIVPKRNPRE